MQQCYEEYMSKEGMKNKELKHTFLGILLLTFFQKRKKDQVDKQVDMYYIKRTLQKYLKLSGY